MFSKACEYAIKAAIYIAQQSLQQKTVNVKEVSAAVNAPIAFTAKILQQLTREQVLRSVRGKQGGFSFDVEQQKVTTVFRIVFIFDGNGIFTNCALGLDKCSSENPCPVHDDYKEIRTRLISMTEQYTFHDLALKTQSGLAWLK